MTRSATLPARSLVGLAIAVALAGAIALTAGCSLPPRPRPVTTAYTSPEVDEEVEDEAALWRTTRESRVEIADAGGWIDPAAGVAGFEVRCFDARVEFWCGSAGCDERRFEERIACEPTPLTIRAPWGATASTELGRTGAVTVVLDAPPADAPLPAYGRGWEVEGPDGRLTWATHAPSSAPPVEAVPPPAPARSPEVPVATHTKRYGASIALVDLLGIGIGAGLIWKGNRDFEACEPRGATECEDVGGGAIILGMVVGVGTYLAGGPFLHLRHHNKLGAAKSALLRLALGFVGPWLVLTQPVVGVPLVLGGLLVDWAVFAKVKVSTYVAPSAGGGATFGLAGAF